MADDRAWLAAFVREDSVTLKDLEVPDEAELLRRGQLHTESIRAKRAIYDSLPTATKEAQELEGRTYASNLVQEIINHVLGSVVQPRMAIERCDKADSLLSALALEEEEGIIEFTTNPVAACTPALMGSDKMAIRRRLSVMHDRILYSKKNSAGLFMQVQSYQQIRNGACGYFALHNGLMCLDIILDKDEEYASCLRDAFTDSVLFWQRYWRTTAVLYQICETQGNRFYPWSNKHVESGVMERNYMTFLCRALNARYAQTAMVEFVPLSESTAIVNGSCTLEQTTALDEVIQRLNAAHNRTVVFFLGLVNHWVTLVVNKVDGDVEFVLVDSLNNKLLDASPASLWQIVQTAVDDKRFTRRKTMSKVEQFLYFQMMHDIGKNVELLSEFISGKKYLQIAWLRSGVRRILDTFHQHVLQGAVPDDAAAAVCNPGLLSIWLANCYHPRLIEEHIHDRLLGPSMPDRLAALGEGDDDNPEGSELTLYAWIVLLLATVQSPDYIAAVDMEAPCLQRFCSTVAALMPLYSYLHAKRQGCGDTLASDGP